VTVAFSRRNIIQIGLQSAACGIRCMGGGTSFDFLASQHGTITCNCDYQLWRRITNGNCADKTDSERFSTFQKLSSPTTQNAEFVGD
jgi:hypothetical protein